MRIRPLTRWAAEGNYVLEIKLKKRSVRRDGEVAEVWLAWHRLYYSYGPRPQLGGERGEG